MREAVFDGASRGAGLDWSKVRRVLLVRLRSIGDTVLMTPCLAALKSWRPDLRLTVLSEPLSAPLLEDHPHVDDLIVAPAGLAARARAVGRLRRERFDVAFNMHGGTTATFLTSLSGARRSVGYKGYRYSWLLDDRATAPDVILGRGLIHSVEQQLALLLWAGVPWPAEGPRLSLNLSEPARVRARARLDEADSGQSRFALIAPSAAFESKRWKAAGFAAVVDHLARIYNLPCLVVAGPGQEQVAREVSEWAHSKPKVLAGLSLKELMALIDMAAIFVGNDSGPAHIAAALSRPMAVVFGSSDVRVWRPWTESVYRVIESAGLPIEQVPDARVIAAVDDVMQSAANQI
ncbi:MAG TPA: glycosyltransferase family 9 protein [Blastocatellia bacterium]|nr:glycosyltransferase family 9 protein [Blastocatellia bacterium]